MVRYQTFRPARILAAAAALLVLAVAAPPAEAAPTLVPISGAGSTWSYNAIDNWRRNIQQSGVFVNYAATGSSDGRNQFANGTVDFGVSEIPYGMRDAFTGTDAQPKRGFAYMPIVAGGTSFMYNLRIGGRRVTNLRLSGQTIARIFTGQIKRWDDPAIKADNPGLRLPRLTVVPVVRQDGSGTSAQFTLWMSKQYPAIWNAYCRRFNKPAPCGLTSSYPYRSQDGFVGQSGSTGVAGYVSQGNAEGAITYVEYSYAINAHFPVVKVLNAAGYYIAPTAKNVAVALTQARINNNKGSVDYLTQQLDGVYNYRDPRTYPLSSYSYMIIPTTLDYGFNTNKGYTLSRFTYYFLCEGQQQADVMGYSPLPINLVKAGFQQVLKIKGVQQQNITVAGCHNPTFSTNGTNTLATTAPQPSPCDKQGPTQSTDGTAGAPQPTPVTSNAACRTSGGGSNNGGTDGGANRGPGGAGPTDGAGPSAGPSAGAAPNGGVDPITGESLGGTGAGETRTGGDQITADNVSLEGEGGWCVQNTLMAIAAVLLLGLVLGPPLLSNALRRRREGGGQ